MQKIQDGVTVTLIIREHQKKKIDEIAERFGIKKAEAHRLILETGLDAYQTFEAVGVVKLAELTRKTRKACENALQPKLI